MSSTSVSTVMNEAINSILASAHTTATEFNISITLTSADNPKFIVVPLFIEEMTITEDYSNAYAEVVTVKFTVSPLEYELIFKNMKDLLAAVTIVYIDAQHSKLVFDPPPINRKYKAILKNPQNLSTKFTTGSLRPTIDQPKTEQHVSARIPVELQMIEYEAYVIRQQQFHAMFSNTNVQALINHIAKVYNIPRLYLVKPDNTHTWSNIVIPPGKSISDIFDFIQVTYGVYMKGIEFFYTDKTLYVYPPYEMRPVIPYTANIFNAPEGAYSGSRAYHATDSKNISIVSTTSVDTKDLAVSSAENTGSSKSFIRASQLIDNFSGLTQAGVRVSHNNSLTVSGRNSRTMTRNANNDRYGKTTDNIFHEASELAKWNATLVKLGWLQAVPYVLRPGHAVKYAYDDNGIFVSKSGILEVVVYKIAHQRRLDVGNTYSCRADMRLRVESDLGK